MFGKKATTEQNNVKWEKVVKHNVCGQFRLLTKARE